MPLWLNAVGFQSAWFVAVFGQVHWGWLAIIWPVIHLTLVTSRRAEVQFMALVVVVGVLVDSILIHFNVFRFEGLDGWIPLWLVVLWSAFSTTLRHCLSWLYRHPLLAAGFGAVGGTLSYLAGYRLGAVQLPLGVPWTAAILAPLWAALLVMFGYCSRWVDRSLDRSSLPAA